MLDGAEVMRVIAVVRKPVEFPSEFDIAEVVCDAILDRLITEEPLPDSVIADDPASEPETLWTEAVERSVPETVAAKEPMFEDPSKDAEAREAGTEAESEAADEPPAPVAAADADAAEVADAADAAEVADAADAAEDADAADAAAAELTSTSAFIARVLLVVAAAVAVETVLTAELRPWTDTARQTGTSTTFVSRLTAAVSAYNPPSNVAPVLPVIVSDAIIVPVKAVSVPMVADVPT